MSEPTLLPCPFCGSAPECYESDKVREKRWFIRCTSGPECDCFLINCRGYTRDDVTAAWNRRAPEPSLTASLEAARAALREIREIEAQYVDGDWRSRAVVSAVDRALAAPASPPAAAPVPAKDQP